MMGNVFGGLARCAGNVVGLTGLTGTDGEGVGSYWMRTPESGDKSRDRITTNRSRSSSGNVGELSNELGKLTLSVFAPGLYVSEAARPLLFSSFGLMRGKKRDGNDGFNATWTRRFKLNWLLLLFRPCSGIGLWDVGLGSTFSPSKLVHRITIFFLKDFWVLCINSFQK